jgi:hypothetical protein
MKCVYENKKYMLHIFGNCNLVQNIWFVVKNFLIICGITLPWNAREIIIGISESYIENQNTINHILLILKCSGADVKEKSHTYMEVLHTSNSISN